MTNKIYSSFVFCLVTFFSTTMEKKPNLSISATQKNPTKISFQFSQNFDNTFTAVYMINDKKIGDATIEDTSDFSTNKGKNIHKTAFLSRVFIEPAFRRSGYATDFLRFILEELKELHFAFVDLKVQPSKDDTIPTQEQLYHFYEKFGFVKLPQAKNEMRCNLEILKLVTIPYASSVKTTITKLLLHNKSYYKS
jgi:ribosomal protein S18 acetylase RimI-like enzyme